MDNHVAKKLAGLAIKDYKSAESMSKTFYPIPLEIVCFLCQQSAEKILKVYLLTKGERLVKTHDVDALLETCKKYDKSFARFDTVAPTLTTFAVGGRYGDTDTVTEYDMKHALKDAKDIMDFTIGKLLDVGFPLDKAEKIIVKDVASEAIGMRKALPLLFASKAPVDDVLLAAKAAGLSKSDVLREYNKWKEVQQQSQSEEAAEADDLEL
jgi:HEPN domain-containing protein